MRVAVTGSSGYLGSLLVSKLKFADYEVGEWDSKAGPEGDLLRPEVRAALVAWGPDVVFNLAGLSGEGACRAASDKGLAINAKMPALLRAELGPECLFVQASSASIMGLVGANVTPYAYSKWAAEQGLKGFANTILARFGTLFGYNGGPGMRWDLAANLMCKTAAQEGVIRLEGPDRWRPWISVGRLAEELCGLVDPLCYGATYRDWSGPLPVAAFNATLRTMAEKVQQASWASKAQTRIKLEIVKSPNEDRRNYSMPALIAGKADWFEAELAWMLTKAEEIA